MKHFLTLVVCASFLSGCLASTGANYRPIIDTANVDLNVLEKDITECQQFAKQKASAAQSALAAAAVGAAFGAVLAAAAGSEYSKEKTARVGAVTAAAKGAASGEKGQREIIRKCLAGRGYNVLG